MTAFPALRFLPASLAFLAAGAVGLAATSARAGTSCTSDSTCDKGFTCQVVGGSGCASPACAPGQNCPAPPPCDTTEIKECVPGPCTVDSDCASDMKCIAHTSGTCSGSAGAPCAQGANCPPPPPPDCTTTTTSECVPNYVLPCTAAADCGDGFTCDLDPPSESCSGGTPASDPGVPNGTAGAPSKAPPPPPDCTTTPSTTKHCTPVTKECHANTDCPTNWMCMADPVPPTACSNSAQIFPDGGVKYDMTTCTPPAPQPTTMHCAPPYNDFFGYGHDNSTGTATGTGTGTAVGSDGSGSTGVPPRTGGGVAGSDPALGTEQNAAADAGAKTSTASTGSGKKDDGGCAVSVGHAGKEASGASLLALLGLAGIARRRRTA